MRRLLVLAFAAIGLGGITTAAALADDPARERASTTRWRVTIENLTPPGPGAPGSQPLSPPLFVVHGAQTDLWSVGGIASHPIAAIAEDANNAVAEAAFARLRGVHDVFTGSGGPIPSGMSRTYTVRTRGGFDRLSVVTMLVNTNDGFTGLDSFRLRGATLEQMAYDAGSERNNERVAFIPGPCCNNPFVRAPEGKLIRMHRGIAGAHDLDPDVWGWEGPAAKITIEQVG